MSGNLAASVLARLLTLAKQRGDDDSLLLNRFGMERLLARVSASPHADRFLLNGALLFALWYETPHWPTLDADLLGDFPAPVLRVYPVYTVIAEKYQAMVMLGQANSRMKDFFDLAVIARRTELDGGTLASAIAATFARRQTALPTERPLALTKGFSEDAAKLRQWQAFLNKNRLEAASLGDTVALLDDLLWPPTQVAAAGTQATATWRPGALRWA